VSRGPSPKPSILKLVSGNPGKRPIGKDEPIPAPGTIEPPDFVKGEARDLWNRLVPDLVRAGLVTSVDWPGVARYCIKLARWLYLFREIEKAKESSPAGKGTTYPIYGADGKVKYVAEFPWASEWRTLDRELRADEGRLGMSAAARTRIRVEKEKGVEKPKDFFSSRGA
jgi:P27 family predicted phage terminase small subunit